MSPHTAPPGTTHNLAAFYQNCHKQIDISDYRNHHGWRRRLFGDMLSIPPPLCQAGGGRQQEPSGQDQYNHKAGPSPTSCRLRTIPEFFLYFSWDIFHRNKPFFAQGIVQPSSYNTRLFCIFHVASWPLGPWLPFPEKYTLLCMSDKS